MPLTRTFILFSPEIILGAFGLLILGLDLVWEGRGRRWAYLSLGGLALALLAAIHQMGQDGSLFAGMFAVDPFTLFFRVVAILTVGMVTLSSVDYLKGRTPYPGEFHSLLLFSTLAMTLMAGAADLVMIFLSLEFLSITSYILTGYLREDVKSNEAAIKYFLYGAITTAAMLYGMSLLYGATGSTNLAQIASLLGSSGAAVDGSVRWLALSAIVLLLAGVGFKIALVPFHQWCPDAYEGAPTPVTAFLSVGPKAAGFAILLRLFLTAFPHLRMDWVALLAGVSVVTMSLGNLVAMTQGNIKRMLAYSSIAQAGYMLIGLVSVGPASGGPMDGVGSTLLFILAYLFTNLGAFVAVIAFEDATGSAAIQDYAGLVRRAPLVATALALFFVSLVGIPPTGGFVGKLFVFGAAIHARLYWLAAIGVVNSVISLYYYLNVVRHMFFLPPREKTPLSLSSCLRVALALSLIMTLLIGIYPQPFIQWAQRAAGLPGG